MLLFYVFQAQLAYTDVLYGASLRAAGFGNPNNSSRVPDIIIRVPAGVYSFRTM